ncbi:LysR family transcriptional regulator [Marinomonas posidonica]|uniref:Transcriptional regulator, LysR family n=1 Tax=Marinomonas posidonica (strain CECT 7376 / NCIMB 14433 / IVIA-Po-181) TaxID=491952 RepID=F6CUH7_MARPP|nr:LysR family transcriptional regulator [Marinomonas posidonica]AEF56397.1 transcriptional regulator, LysR family [Marinomonas posidonica IVIA-Po-181]
MQLQAITYFNELVRSRSIRQAAETLGVSPTAISRQLENLEHYFGAPLVMRGARGIILTAAGEVLAARSRSMMRDLENARQVIDDLRGLKRGNVSIHINGAAINAILAPALAEFYKLYPAVSIEVTVSSAQEAINAVINGNTDMAVTMFSPSEQQIDVRFKLNIHHNVVMAFDHPLAQLNNIPLELIRKYPMAMPDRSFGIRRTFDQRQRNAGFEPIEAAFTTSSLELQKELACHRTAVVILPAMSVIREIRSGELVVRPFEQQFEITTDLQLGRAKTTAPSFAAAKLADFLEEFLPTQARFVHDNS